MGKIPEQHMAFYFQKYFKKPINPKMFGKDSVKDLITGFVKETVTIEGEPAMFSSNLTEEAQPEMFVKLTEEKRRERQRRIDAGDETARLKFTPPAGGSTPAAGAPAGGKAGGKAGGQGAKK